jgi:hypothetical protein
VGDTQWGSNQKAFTGHSSSLCLASLLAEEKIISVSVHVVGKQLDCEEIW